MHNLIKQIACNRGFVHEQAVNFATLDDHKRNGSAEFAHQSCAIAPVFNSLV